MLSHRSAETEQGVQQKGVRPLQMVKESKEFKVTEQAQLSLFKELAPGQRCLAVYTGTIGKVPRGQGRAL